MAVRLTILSAFDDRGIRNAQKRLAEFGSSTKGFAGSTAADMIHIGAVGSRVSDAMVSTGAAVTRGFTLPLLALGGLAVREFIKFESAFAGVRKTVDASEADFAKLETGIRDMAKELPSSREEIAGVAEAAGQLGIKTENILGFTRVMIDLGESTNMSSDQAATSLARLANITGMPQTAFSNLGSTIVALGNNFATTESEITEMAMRIAGSGTQIGLTEAQILGFSAALSSMGIEAEAGGTAISQMMTTIDKEVAANSEGLKAWAEVAGMSAADFAKAWETDAAGALQKVFVGLGNVKESGGNLNVTLEELGVTGIRQSDMLKRLAGGSDLLAGALDTAGTAWDENSALAKEAEQRYATVESKLGILKNRASDVGLTLGEALIPAFTDALTAAQPLIDKAASLAEKFAALDPATQGTIIKIAALAAAAAPAMSILGKFGGVVFSTITGMGNLGLAFTENAESAPKWAQTIAKGTTGLKNLGSALVKNTVEMAKWIAAQASMGITMAKNTVISIAHKVATLAQTVATKAAAAAQWLLNAALSANPIGLVVVAIAALVAAFVLAWKNSDKFREVVTNAWNSVKNAALAVVEWFKTEPPKAFAKVKDAAVSKFTEMVAWIKGVPGKITSALGNLGNLLKAAGLKLIQGLWDGALERWKKVKAWVSGIAKWIADHKGPLDYDYKLLQPAGRAIMEGFRDSLAAGFSLVQRDLDGYTAQIGGQARVSLSASRPAAQTAPVQPIINFNQPVRTYSEVIRAQRDIAEGLFAWQ